MPDTPIDIDGQQPNELHNMLTRAFLVVCSLSIAIDGFLAPPDDGGWHNVTVIISGLTTSATIICNKLFLQTRPTLAGWVLLGCVTTAGMGMVTSGTPMGGPMGGLGTALLLMIIPQAMLQSRAPHPWRWVISITLILYAMLGLRTLLRGNDWLVYDDDLYSILFLIPGFLFATRIMADRLIFELRSALANSERSRQKLQERTEQLAEALALAEQANAAKSTFLANMSHELRTPLNAIIGYAELVEEELEDVSSAHADAMREDIDQITGAGRHLLQLVSDVLDLTHIESNKLVLDEQDVDVDALVARVHGMMHKQLTANQNTTTLEANTGAVMHTDPVRVEQILLNLLSNAGKFTTSGSITVRTHTTGGRVHIEVKDTGTGIEPAQLERIFELFEQADTSTTREYDGAGLGLALSKQLASLLGAELDVTSEVGVGSTFTLSLPST